MYAILKPDKNVVTLTSEVAAAAWLKTHLNESVFLDLGVGYVHLPGRIEMLCPEESKDLDLHFDYAVVTESGAHVIRLRADGVLAALPGVPRADYAPVRKRMKPAYKRIRNKHK